jgi:hypothetical protein
MKPLRMVAMLLVMGWVVWVAIQFGRVLFR